MKRLAGVLVVIAVLGFGTSRGYDWWNYNVNTPVSSTSQPVVFQIDPGELPSQVSRRPARAAPDQGSQRVRPVPQGHRSRVELRGGLVPAQPQHDDGPDRRRPSARQVDAGVSHHPRGVPASRTGQVRREIRASARRPTIFAIAAEPSWSASYDFLASRPAKAKPPLEGYLFPDTYLVDPGDVRGLIKAQLDQFGNVFSASSSSADREAHREPAGRDRGVDRHPRLDGGSRGQHEHRPRQRLQRLLQPPEAEHATRCRRHFAVRARDA